MLTWVNTVPHGALQLGPRTSSLPTPAEVVSHLLIGGTVESTSNAFKRCKFKWEERTLWILEPLSTQKVWTVCLKDMTPSDIKSFIRQREDYGWVLVD